MHSFESNAAAKEFVREHVDRPVANNVEALGDGIVLQVYPLELEVGRFSNVYDLSFPADKIRPSIELHSRLTSVFEYTNANSDIKAATGGGFFFLADQASTAPRQLGLNLALAGSQVYGFPVVDREAVLSESERLTAEYIQALGVLGINGSELSWSGSLTQHETDVKVYANGNSIITHVQSDTTGSMRILDESSRYTPVIQTDDTVDVGFIRRDDGVFVGVSQSSTGNLDIFGHDVVVRTHERYAHRDFPEMRVLTLGNRAVDGTLQGGVSAGPMIDSESFTGHPINKDESLGGKPPFLDVPLAQIVLFETENGIVHLRLFDGRPGSPVFPGVTADQAAQVIRDEEQVVWGCFLDPGQTAKLVVRSDEEVASYGNTHYLKWPQRPDEKYIWAPKTGRPVASMITLR